jgi:prepilin-type N-terminal cleavage/methylation domain-containing protein
MIRQTHSTRRGFTLIEAIATITVLAALGSVSSTIIYTAVSAYTQASIAAQLHAEASTAMERLMSELDKIPLDAGASGVAPDIASVSATAMTWNTNYSVTLSGTQLGLVVAGAASSVLLDNVSSFAVATYDESNAALGATLSGTGCDPIRRILLTITVTSNGVSSTLRSKIFIRSTMEAGASS